MKINRRTLLAGLVSSASILAVSSGHAGVWMRAMSAAIQVSAAPITAPIPAHYSTVISPTGDGYIHAPLPAFSLGPSATPMLVDTSLVNQGGTGRLTDSLTDANVTSGDGVGDSAGFGVVNGELMLVNYMDYRHRTSGAARIMRWVQTLGAQTVTQNIMLTLDPSQGRIWNGTLRPVSGDTTTLASHAQALLQTDFPLTTGITVPPQGIAGLTYFVGCPDAKRIAGLKSPTTGSPGWGGGKYPTSQAVVSDLLMQPDGSTIAFSSLFRTNSQGNGNPNIQGAPTGTNLKCQLVSLAPPSGATLPVIVDGYDFSDVQVGINTSGIKFTNCYFGSRWIARWANWPGMSFTLINCRAGDGATDTDRSHMYIDNIDDLLAFHDNIAADGFGIYGRAIYPSAPVYAADPTWNPFIGTGNSTVITPTLVDIFQHPMSGKKYIKLNITVPSTGNKTNGLPAGLCCNLAQAISTDVRNPNGLGVTPQPYPGGDNVSSLSIANVTVGLEDCTADGRVLGVKFTQTGLDNIPITAPSGNGGFGPDDNGNGVHVGMRHCAVINTPQDCLGVSCGTVDNSALISRAMSNGSHVDGEQLFNTPSTYPGFTSRRPSLLIRNSTITNVTHYAKATDLIDPIVGGVSTNAYAVMLGGNVMKVGGQNACLFFEVGKQSGGQGNWGDVIGTGCILQGATYSQTTQSVIGISALFTQSNPASVLLNTNNYPGYGPGGTGYNNLGDQISFMSVGTLPPAITAHKLYTIVGYSLCFITTLASSTLHDLSIGDILVVTSGITVVGGLGAATFMVTALDGSGVPTLAVVNPGQYTTNLNGGAFNLSIQSSASGSAGGTVTASNSLKWYSFTLRDPATGLLVDTSASSTGTGGSTTTGSGGGGAQFKTLSSGLISCNNNYVSEISPTTVTYLNKASSDAAGNPRPEMDNISIYNTRWLYGAPPIGSGAGKSLAVAAGTGATDGPFSYMTPAGQFVDSINPPPTAITTLAASSVSTTQMRVTFTADKNARLSPDGGVVNASGYQYILRPNGGAWPTDGSGNISWANLPAAAVTSGNATVVLPDAVTSGQRYDVMVRGVSCYDSPRMQPMQVAANSNIASVLMPAA